MELTATKPPAIKSEPKQIKRFWIYITDDKTKEVKFISIDHKKFIDFLKQNGFQRFDMPNHFIFVWIVNNVIDQVQIPFIQDFILKYVQNFDENAVDNFQKWKEQILYKFYASPGTYFTEKKFSLLTPELIELNTDNKTTCFIYYKNGFVECTANGYDLKPYSQLKKQIFKNQIINRDFIKGISTGNFSKFCFYISEPNHENPKGRFESLKTLIGYLAHSYYDTKMKAVCLTDSTISESDEGRTGKTLIGKALAKIKNVCEISGKSFNPENKFRYSEAEISTQVTFLNDLKKDFNFEMLYNDISEGITVEQKNKQSFPLRTKMIVSANSTLKISGASGKDRIIEFELTGHYSDKHTPQDDFKEWFFSDWDKTGWSQFDNFMMECISKYLNDGIIEPVQINLNRRKLIDHTNPDFYDWMEEQVQDKNIVPYERYEKKQLHEKFLDIHPEYRANLRSKLRNLKHFSKLLKVYADLSPDFGNVCHEDKSNGVYYIEFTAPETNTKQ